MFIASLLTAIACLLAVIIADHQLGGPLHGVGGSLLMSGGLLALVWPRLRPMTRIQPLRAACAQRVKLKLLSLCTPLALLLLYGHAMTYTKYTVFSTFMSAAALMAMVLVPLLPVYAAWADRRLEDLDDDCLRFGQWLTGRRPWLWREQQRWIQSWALKIFFIPLMFGGLILMSDQLVRMTLQWQSSHIIEYLFIFGIYADLLIGTFGYLFSSKFLDNDIKSMDPHWSSWLICLCCYPPFNEALHTLTAQRDDLNWNDWLTPNHWLYWPWAIAVASTWIVYWLATAQFRLRFSNLSWRGLVDTGPYRYTKHPAFISKNLHWWLATVPFVGVHNTMDLIRNVAGMSILSFVYYLRAKTEERYLLQYNEYADYIRRIDGAGIFSLKRYVK